MAPTKAEAGVRWEQELARLFVRSGWTQGELAKREGRPRPYVTRLLLFGRFLSFVPMGTNAESVLLGLTERRFRDFWDRTDKCGGNEWLYSVPRPACGVSPPLLWTAGGTDEIGGLTISPESRAPAAHDPSTVP
jgi:hypothetical protein